LRPALNEWDNALLAANVSVDDVVNHIDYMVKLVGSDFVGLGSDFDGISCPPDQLEDVSRMPSITKALLERNYEEEDIKKILGGNFMRVFAEVCG
jgi:membrane dipeptidase